MKTRRIRALFAVAAALTGNAIADAQKVYWAETPDTWSSLPYDATIRRADSDGTNSEIVVWNELKGTRSIVVDSLAGNIYISGLPGIERWRADGTPAEVLFPSEYGKLALDLERRKIYWANLSTIKRANLDGTNVETIVSGVNCCTEGIALDLAGEVMYWTDRGLPGATDGTVFRSTYDGQNTQVVLSGLTDPTTLALDPDAAKLYWWGASGPDEQDPNPGLFRCDTDGSHLEEINPDEWPGASVTTYPLALDLTHGKLYYARGWLHRSNLDGTDDENVAPINGITGLWVDALENSIYWTTAKSISRANLDDITAEEPLYEDPIRGPKGIALDTNNGWLYWSDVPSQINRARLDGREPQVVINPGPESATRIALDENAEVMYWTSSHKIRRASIPGGEPQDVLVSPPIRWPRGIAFNPMDGKLYWAEIGDAAIRRVDPESSQVEDLVVGTDPGEVYEPWGIALDLPHETLYWSDSSRIRRSNFDGTEIETVVEGLDRPLGIVVEPSTERVFWTEFYGGQIRVANIDGSNVETLLDEGVDCPAGLAINWPENRLYWVDVCPSAEPTIRRARLDGTEIETIISEGLLWPREVVIAPTGDRIYWTDAPYYYGDRELGSIKQANLDGSGARVVSTGIVSFPRGMAFDSANNLMYWSEGDGQGSIQSSQFDGSSCQEVITALLALDIALLGKSQEMFVADGARILRATSNGMEVEQVVETDGARRLAIDTSAEKVYWTQNGTSSIHRVDFDGSNSEVIISTETTNRPDGIALDSTGTKVYWTSHNRVWRANVDGSAVELLHEVEGLDLELSGGLAVNDVPHVYSSLPKPCTIDARQPHDINDFMFRYGWSEIDLEFSGTLGSGDPLDFEVLESGGDGVPPNIESVTVVGDGTVHIALDDVIEPGAWTCFYHINSGTKSCLGYLPGDVNEDGTSSPVDILRLIDSLNEVVDPPYDIWQTDIDRSGVAEPGDILRLIDLLNGASKFEVWNGRTLGACP